MKASSEIFVLTLLFVNSWCYYDPNKKPKTTTKAPITKYYVDNWYNNRMPKEISVQSLKSVLDLIAKYRGGQYCPYGDFEYCDDKKSKEVVDKIILDIVSAEKKEIAAKAEANSPCGLATKMPERSLAMCMAKSNFLREKNSKLKTTSRESMDIWNDLTEYTDFDDVKYERKHNGKQHKKHHNDYDGHDDEEALMELSDEDLTNLIGLDDVKSEHKHNGKLHEKHEKKSHKKHHKDYEGDDDEGELTELTDEDLTNLIGLDDVQSEHKDNGKLHKKHGKKSHKKQHNDYEGDHDEGELTELTDEDLTDLIGIDDVKSEHKHNGKLHKKHGKKSHKKHHNDYEGDDDERELTELSNEDLTELIGLDDVKYEHKHKGNSQKKHKKKSHKKHKKHHRHHKHKGEDDEAEKFKGSIIVLHAYNSLKVRKHLNKFVNIRDIPNQSTFGKR